MKKLLLVSLAVITLASCRKDPEPIISAGNTDAVHIPSTPGSWWAYQWYEVDSMGNQTPTQERDTMYVIGDTTIQGNQYTHYRRTIFYQQGESDFFLRDSSGYIVNSGGIVYYTYNRDAGVISEQYFAPSHHRVNQMANWNEVTQTAAGAFTTIDLQGTVSDTTGQPMTSCGDQVFHFHNRYADGIGLVEQTTGFLSQLSSECSYLKMELDDYYIAY